MWREAIAGVWSYGSELSSESSLGESSNWRVCFFLVLQASLILPILDPSLSVERDVCNGTSVEKIK